MIVTKLTPLQVPSTPVAGAAWLWRTDASVTSHVVMSDGTVDRITVPAGFETDGPSIPGLVRSVVRVTNVEWAASVVHDWQYQYRPRGVTWWASIRLKVVADRRFRRNLAHTRANWGLTGYERVGYWIKHNLAVWPAVVVGGWKAWIDDD